MATPLEYPGGAEGDKPTWPFDLGMDLTGLTLTFRARKPDGGLLAGNVQIDDAAKGLGSFTVTEPLPQGVLPGEIRFSAGPAHQQTIPDDAAFLIRVRPAV